MAAYTTNVACRVVYGYALELIKTTHRVVTATVRTTTKELVERNAYIVRLTIRVVALCVVDTTNIVRRLNTSPTTIPVALAVVVVHPITIGYGYILTSNICCSSSNNGVVLSFSCICVTDNHTRYAVNPPLVVRCYVVDNIHYASDVAILNNVCAVATNTTSNTTGILTMRIPQCTYNYRAIQVYILECTVAACPANYATSIPVVASNLCVGNIDILECCVVSITCNTT